MFRNRHTHLLLTVLFAWAMLGSVPVRADLAVPVWYTEVGAPAGWHYRVPVTLPAATATNSTVVLNVDFHALLTGLGVNASAVDFDEGSVRLVRPNGLLASRQEFTDRIYNGVLDPAGNGRGEIRFLAQETATGYFLYFDITANGAKPAAPGVSPINGHFEQSAGSTPTGWVVSSLNTGGAQNNEVYRTSLGSTMNLAAGCSNGAANGLDTGPNAISGSATGEAWHLLGYRNNCEDGSGNERVRLSRDIAVPSGAAAGELEFYFQVQSFDGISGASTYDWVTFYVNGTAVNHTTLGIVNTGSPTLMIETGRLGRSGYGNSVQDFGWKRARLNLSTYAGSTINFRIETWHYTDNAYRSWVKIDDVQWSRQNATLGTVQAFGANVIAPADTAVAAPAQYSSGQRLRVAVALNAGTVGATADLYNNSGGLVLGGILLYDNGTHGDTTAGDRIWTNDGSVPAQPTYTFQASDLPGNSWRVRAFARDASVAVSGGSSGLLRIPGQPLTPLVQANYFNIDEQTFILAGARMVLTKTIVTLQDPAGGSQPKSVPGAWLRYNVRVVNEGPSAADNNTVVLVDAIPPELQMCVQPACTCVGACTPVNPVSFDASASPIPTGLTYDYATHVRYSLDGVDFTYVPVPDPAGFDPAVRYVRVAPAGAMAAPGVPGQAEFTLRYVVRLQ